jgi:hypothetical protein
LIASGKMSAVEALDMFLKRTERYDAAINAIVVLDPEVAKKRAHGAAPAGYYLRPEVRRRSWRTAIPLESPPAVLSAVLPDNLRGLVAAPIQQRFARQC